MTEKIKRAHIGREIVESSKTLGRAITAGIILSLPLVGAGRVLNGTEKAMRYGFEKTIESRVEHKEYDAILEKKKEVLMLGTHGTLLCGDFRLNNGQKVTIYDGAYLSQGKFWENSTFSALEEGTVYHLSVAGNDTLGWTLLNAEKN